MENVLVKPDCRPLFRKIMLERGINLAFTADRLGVTGQHLGQVLMGRRVLIEEYRAKLNEFFGTDY
jgi:plasmid maintenance system antidote protein VapI